MDKPAAAVIGDFLRRLEHTDPAQRVKILAAGVPVAASQHVALHHDDPWLRRRCLDLLDHHAADDCTDVFLAALDDPVAPVREIALHGLACERCRATEVCVADVVPRVIRTLDEDPAAEVATAPSSSCATTRIATPPPTSRSNTPLPPTATRYCAKEPVSPKAQGCSPAATTLLANSANATAHPEAPDQRPPGTPKPPDGIRAHRPGSSRTHVANGSDTALQERPPVTRPSSASVAGNAPPAADVAFRRRGAPFSTVSTDIDTQTQTPPNNRELPPALLTISEAAARLRIGRSTAYELIACGDLEVVHIGRSARVPVEAVDDLVQILRARSGNARTRVTRLP